MTDIVRGPDRVEGPITPAELTQLHEHADLWIRRALRTEPADPAIVKQAVLDLYKNAGLPPPRVVLAPSPLAMAFAYGAAAAIWHQRDLKSDAAETDTAQATRGLVGDELFQVRRGRPVPAKDATRSDVYRYTSNAVVAATAAAVDTAVYRATVDDVLSVVSGAKADVFAATEGTAVSGATAAKAHIAERATDHANDVPWSDLDTLDIGVDAVMEATRVALGEALSDDTSYMMGIMHATPENARRQTNTVLVQADDATDAATEANPRAFFAVVQTHWGDVVGATLDATDSAVTHALNEDLEETPFLLDGGATRHPEEIRATYRVQTHVHAAMRSATDRGARIAALGVAGAVYDSTFDATDAVLRDALAEAVVEATPDEALKTVVNVATDARAATETDTESAIRTGVNYPAYLAVSDAAPRTRAVAHSVFNHAVLHDTSIATAQMLQNDITEVATGLDARGDVERGSEWPAVRATGGAAEKDVRNLVDATVTPPSSSGLVGVSLLQDALDPLSADASDVVQAAANACVALAGEFGLACALKWYRAHQAGNMAAGSSAYISAMRDVLGLRLPEHEAYEPWETLSIEGGFRVMHKEFCIVSDFPEFIRRDGAGQPHCEDGPSHRWRDGWELFHWHGLRIPRNKTWIITNPEKLTPEAIEEEPNAEIRRAMLEISGFERYLEERGAKVISEDTSHGRPRRLLEIQVGDETLRVLDVYNGSLEPDGSRRRYFIGAMPDTGTPHEAVAASYGIAADVYEEGVRT